MTYPSEPLTVIGQPLGIPFDRGDASPPSGRSRVKLILLGNPDAVDQSVIELERISYGLAN